MNSAENKTTDVAPADTVLGAWRSQMASAGCPQDLLARIITECKEGMGAELWDELSPSRQMRYARTVAWSIFEQALSTAPATSISAAVAVVKSDEMTMPGGPAKLAAEVRRNVASGADNTDKTVRAAEQALLRATDTLDNLSGVVAQAQRLTKTLESMTNVTTAAVVQPGVVEAHPEKVEQMAAQVFSRWNQALALVRAGGLWYEPWTAQLGKEVSYGDAEDFMHTVWIAVQKLPETTHRDLPAIKSHFQATLVTIDAGVRELLRKNSRGTLR